MSSKDVPSITQELDQFEADLRAYLVKPPFWLQFPHHINEQFEIKGRPGRLKRFWFTGWVSLVAFDLFLLVDIFLVGDVLSWALLIRVLCVTPLAVILLLLLRQERFAPWREWMTGGFFLLGSIGQMLVAGASGSSLAPYYFLLQILILLTCTLVARVRFRVAVPFTAVLICITMLEIFVFAHDLPLTAQAWCAVVVLAISAIALIVKRQMELDNRATYALKKLHAIAEINLGKANMRLSELATRDALTNIANRRMLDEQLPLLWRNCMRNQSPLAVIFVDIDFFKRYNDHYGHGAGDECLRWVAEMINVSARRSLDLVARYGGEEFVVVLPDTELDQALIVAERMLAKIIEGNKPHQDSPFGKVTISIGVVASIPVAGQHVDTLVEAADAALYQAKTGGRARVVSGTVAAAAD